MTISSQTSIYDNGAILAPDGELLCRCSLKKLNWYINHNLASWESNDHLTIRLKFEPSGRSPLKDPIDLISKVNKCVVCGIEDNLTKHHIVPYCYRKHFPKEIKRHSSYDVVPLCIPCHKNYEKIANLLKVKLNEELGFEFFQKHSSHSVGKVAFCLLKHKDKMPPEKVIKLINILKDYFKKEIITIDDLELASDLNKVKRESRSNFGEFIVKNCGDLQDFVERWRSHFFFTMNPKFMIDGWEITRKIGR